jgi:serine/threonine protein kinase
MEGPGTLKFHVPSKYRITSFINEGSYGTVWQGQDIESGKIVAIKKIHDFCGHSRYPSGSPLQHRFLKKVYREILVMNLFSGCPEFISLLDLYTDPDANDMYIVMDFMPLSLRDAVHQPAVKGVGLEEAAVRYIALQLLAGIDRMAKHRCIHRDLSPSNVLFNLENCRIAISDFGLVRAFFRENDPLSLDVVTLPYRPPELLMLSPVTDSKIDVWSVGIVLVELLLGGDFIHAKDMVATFRLIVERVADVPSLERWRNKASEKVLNYLDHNWAQLKAFDKKSVRTILQERGNISPAAIDVIEQLLQVFPDDRISAEAALKMPWFQDDFIQSELAVLSSYSPSPERHALLADAEELPADEMRRRILLMTNDLRGTECLELAYASGKHQ